MRDPFFRTPSPSSQACWLRRVYDNFHQLVTPSRVFPSSANGAPLHLLRWEKSAQAVRAQKASLVTHAAILTALLLVALSAPHPKPPGSFGGETMKGILPVPHSLLDLLRGQDPRGGTGNGSGHDGLPPTRGNLPALSSVQLLKPMLPQRQDPELPVPPTILDSSAPAVLVPVDGIGIPWMPEENNSSGRGKGHTIGDGTNDSIGDTPGDFTGQGGPRGPYQSGITLPKCSYCPDPIYTDQAREAKLQGRVTLRVLVGADGRAAQVQILQGLGMGLDERAAETLRTWKFVPARDAARHAVPCWVTIEVTFHLI